MDTNNYSAIRVTSWRTNALQQMGVFAKPIHAEARKFSTHHSGRIANVPNCMERAAFAQPQR